MPQYTLAAPEEKIIVSWLFEPNGYLDYATRVSDGLAAREALAADPALDITQWCRDNPLEEPEMYECGMVWWIWKHSNVNIPPPGRPPEAPYWATTLQRWDISINAGFARVPKERRVSGVNIWDENVELIEQMPQGAHLAHQQAIITKVLGVLQ